MIACIFIAPHFLTLRATSTFSHGRNDRPFVVRSLKIACPVSIIRCYVHSSARAARRPLACWIGISTLHFSFIETGTVPTESRNGPEAR